MKISITGEETGRVSPADLKGRLTEVLCAEGAALEWELSVLLTGDVQISRLHKRWMDMDGPTDVMSFPLDDPLETDEVSEGCLGDVVVSVDTAERQAEAHGHCLQTEVVLLAVHGTLHLLGYDDLDEMSRREMRSREQRYVPEAFPVLATKGPHLP